MTGESLMVSMREQSARTLASENYDIGTSDARLVEEVRRGDRDAFGALVLRYERRLIRVINRFTRDEELARDLAQETFLRFYERIDQFDTSRRFGPWLFRIGVNLALDHLRRRKRKIRWSLFSEASNETGPDPASPDPRPQMDLSQEVQAVLEELPERFQTVLMLRDLENFSTSEIASILNRREATIRWRLAEARTRFQRIWTRRQGEGTLPLDEPQEKQDSDDEL